MLCGNANLRGLARALRHNSDQERGTAMDVRAAVAAGRLLK
jgi:hypothetical protein